MHTKIILAVTDMEEEVKEKMSELSKTNEEIQKAKDLATQSWLDSMPVINELEKMKLQLEKSKNQAFETNITLSQLQGELESVHGQIRDRNEGGREANKIISETNQALDQTREDMEQFKEATDEEKRRRAELKQTLRVKRQELRKVQLTLRAVRMETEAYNGSEAEAVKHVNRLETEDSTVQLSREDYDALTKRAREETSLGDWRVSISVEQRLVAEASREAAVKRLKEYYSEQRSKNKLAEEEEKEEDVNVVTENGNAGEISTRSRSTRGSSIGAFSSRRSESNQVRQHEKERGSNGRRSRSGHVQQKQRTSIFYRIRRFFVLKIARLFK